MDIQDYISSGILESYVLGDLDAEKSAEVETLASKHPEIRKELEEIEDTLLRYASSHSKTPPVGMKERILDELNTPAGKEVKVDFRESSDFAKYFAAASIVMAIGLGFSTLYYFNKYQEAQGTILALESEKSQTASNYQVLEKKYGQLDQNLSAVKSELALVLDTNMVPIQLKGMPLSPESRAVVMWNKTTKEVFIDVKSLPAAPSDKQYQLWALADGKPLDAGVFEVENDSILIQKLKSINSAQAFAVTLETKGGSIAPTLDAMYLMGQIKL